MFDYDGSSVALLDAATATGAGVASAPRRVRRAFHARGATTAGAGSVTVVIEVSLVPTPTETDWLTLGTITLTLSTTPTGDGFATDSPWRWVRGRVSAISGTGAAVSLWLGT